MKLSVATNFDSRLIDGIKDYPVASIYGKLPVDFFGGGRSTYMLGKVSKAQLIEHVAYAKKNKIGFNYLLNASCLSNMETTRKGQKELRKILDWLCHIEVSSVTISNPLLLRIIKQNYPQLKVRVSVFAGVDHLQKAKFWEDIGADTICLDSLSVNRDLEALKSLSKSIRCNLELLANGNCMASCSMAPTHMNLLSHSSQKKDLNGRFVVDHCVLECAKRKLKNPVNFLRSDWIRPEDIHLYEELGYQNFKLVERNLPTSIMIKRVQAYSERKYEGNLIDLIQPYGHKACKDDPKYNAHTSFLPLRYFVRPLKINVARLFNIKKLTEKRGMLCQIKEDQPPIYIDNQGLDGFLEEVWRRKCRYNDCEKCGYCESVTRKVVVIKPEFQKDCLELHKQIDHDLEQGSLWL
ncbi:MAG: hypothetical protein A2381_16040 [Bdellovibrionales bacterium RIFOXYB1_FULL_37_110]|nr:MAG: hypothetical protein A2417_07890 [Bdellovibrionales bacterium RIFOXYC1_FULL_37_79]OFZ57124.1 MAG: hypothetical protein A2381_16040 [Bdellovibrionales bacterium RIFOXYB1_FULL_37_110]OFZ65392.1 MAG: hypothetical protein A2577_03830 [Bdellovibrionales bacterium RIFOXYD1_FULL_36_51]